MSQNEASPNPVTAVDGTVTSVSALLNSVDQPQDQLNGLFDLVYGELKRIARRVLSSHSGQATLSPTVLVHEVYVKLIGADTLDIRGRAHFYALCARTMRQIVVDHARARLTEKRGSGQLALALTDDGAIDLSQPDSLVALDTALTLLQQRDPRLVEILHYRVFVGLELTEIAPLLGVSLRQLQRDWQRAKIWITDAMVSDS